MVSIWQVTRESFSFLQNNFFSIVRNLWVVVALNILINYGMDLEGISLGDSWSTWINDLLRPLILLVLSPFYARPIFNMIVKKNFKRPNVLGMTWSKGDTRYFLWNCVLLVMFLATIALLLLLGILLGSVQDTLGTLFLLICFIVLIMLYMMHINRFLMTLLSFYDKKTISFKESLTLTRGQVIKIFIATMGIFLCFFVISHYLRYPLLGEIIETIATVLQVITSCMVYKAILKKA
jgi:hypothetical protein